MKRKIFTLILIIVLICSVVIYKKNKVSQIELTQFAPTTTKQMMGYAILTQKKKIVLIDGGTKEDADQLKEYILNNGGTVDIWFITHPHIDHAGAFEVISQDENIKIKQIYMSLEDKDWYLENEPSRTDDINEFFEIIEEEKIQEKIIEPEVNDIITIDNISCKILGIKNPEITSGAINNSSMVIQMQVNDTKILFLADTGSKSSEKLINTQSENLKSDIVQMSHHGQSGATKELYELINPSICLWPTPQWLWENNLTGEEDSRPWKTKQTRQWMEELNVQTHYVAKDGTITITVA